MSENIHRIMSHNEGREEKRRDVLKFLQKEWDDGAAVFERALAEIGSLKAKVKELQRATPEPTDGAMRALRLYLAHGADNHKATFEAMWNELSRLRAQRGNQDPNSEAEHLRKLLTEAQAEVEKLNAIRAYDLAERDGLRREVSQLRRQLKGAEDLAQSREIGRNAQAQLVRDLQLELAELKGARDACAKLVEYALGIHV